MTIESRVCTTLKWDRQFYARENGKLTIMQQSTQTTVRALVWHLVVQEKFEA